MPFSLDAGIWISGRLTVASGQDKHIIRSPSGSSTIHWSVTDAYGGGPRAVNFRSSQHMYNEYPGFAYHAPIAGGSRGVRSKVCQNVRKRQGITMFLSSS